MRKEDFRIVYMGTPDFAVESLRALVEGGYNVVAVVTMPDKPIGRHGSVLQPSPVKQYALEQGLRGFPHAARNCMEHASLRHFQCACQLTA